MVDKISGDNRERAFFGRRKARPIKKSRASLIRELLPKLNIALDQPAPPDLKNYLSKPLNLQGGNTANSKVILEIGFGGGEHLVQRAAEEPQNIFIGCEPFIDGMGKALAAIEANDLSNIRLYDQDAIQLLDWLPEKSVDILYLLYPDPWPKKRHWKRRFINVKNLERITRVIKTNGEFRFASDIAHYVNWVLLAASHNDALMWNANNALDWHQPWRGWQSTRYEQKAIREGRTSAYLTFIKQK